MTLALIFWICMLLYLLWSLPFNQWAAGYPYASSILLFILFLALGWAVFGAAIKG
jgi:hypothetical protein